MLDKIRAARVNGAVKAGSTYQRAIEAGASPEVSLRCAATSTSHHGQRRTFRQANPDATSDKQAKQRALLNRAARKADLTINAEQAAYVASVHPTRETKRRAKRLAVLAAKIEHDAIAPKCAWPSR